MKLLRLAKLHSKRHANLGPVFYIASVQYFLVQFLVAQRWSPSYSISRDTISDLGNTNCATFDARFVCSPLHNVMNASFIILGIGMILGSALIVYEFAKSRGTALGLASMALSGVGVIMVGVFPENTVSVLHVIGAAIPFVIGNVAIIMLGFSMKLSAPFRLYSFLSGVIAIFALGCYTSSHYLGLGEGGIERVVAYPQTVWLIATGLYILRAKSLRPAPGSRVYDSTNG